MNRRLLKYTTIKNDDVAGFYRYCHSYYTKKLEVSNRSGIVDFVFICVEVDRYN